ncbi:putative Chymotrypsin-C [Hypsibius exemplaris]|uniref:Chymotrypsin-C n=1 Tax=Hypsibius exemplaris TaxID=2072580 RepID=A0A9X6RN90_HYPEX|nr:putative Chymotrypsin-C [Hypsibius exemplaris]
MLQCISAPSGIAVFALVLLCSGALSQDDNFGDYAIYEDYEDVSQTTRRARLMATTTRGPAEFITDDDFGEFAIPDVTGPSSSELSVRAVTTAATTASPEMDADDYTIDDEAAVANGPLEAAILPGATVPPPNLDPDEAVIGGMTVPRHKYPFMVSIQLQKDNFHFCGGSLISSIHVLTAAHCLANAEGKQTKQANAIQVGVGLHNRKTNDSSHYFGVKRIDIHRGYIGISNGHLNDIAILTLDRSIAGAKKLKVGIIMLPAGPRDDPRPSTAVRAIGWGLTSNRLPGLKSEPAHVLQYAQFKVLNQLECGRRTGEANKPVAASKMCIDSSNVAVCQGDSGGPLFRQLRNGKYQIDGVASYVIGSCLGENSANVFTRVSHHVPWIKTTFQAAAPPRSTPVVCQNIKENGMTCTKCSNGYRWSKNCSTRWSKTTRRSFGWVDKKLVGV